MKESEYEGPQEKAKESGGGEGVVQCRELEAGFGSSERVLTHYPPETDRQVKAALIQRLNRGILAGKGRGKSDWPYEKQQMITVTSAERRSAVWSGSSCFPLSLISSLIISFCSRVKDFRSRENCCLTMKVMFPRFYQCKESIQFTVSFRKKINQANTFRTHFCLILVPLSNRI